MNTRKPRPEFREWIDEHPTPQWSHLPLTHISKSFIAKDIVRDGVIEPRTCETIGVAVSFFFYGRPAYRPGKVDEYNIEATCPFCFIMSPNILSSVHVIHAFDTGAFAKRLYKYALIDDMNMPDFSLESESARIQKLISKIYGSNEAYMSGDLSQAVIVKNGLNPDDFLPDAYLDLLCSAGKNGPDDRVGSIEVTFSDPVALKSHLLAIVVPDCFWSEKYKAAWILELADSGVTVSTFRYTNNKSPEHHHALLEQSVHKLYEDPTWARTDRSC